MQLSEKLKTFSEIFLVFSESIFSLTYFEKNKTK